MKPWPGSPCRDKSRDQMSGRFGPITCGTSKSHRREGDAAARRLTLRPKATQGLRLSYRSRSSAQFAAAKRAPCSSRTWCETAALRITSPNRRNRSCTTLHPSGVCYAVYCSSHRWQPTTSRSLPAPHPPVQPISPTTWTLTRRVSERPMSF